MWLPWRRSQIEIDGPEVYALTFKRTKTTVESFLIDRTGTIRKKVFLPLIEENVMREYPFDIHNGIVYQLIENEETEEWVLHVTPQSSW